MPVWLALIATFLLALQAPVSLSELKKAVARDPRSAAAHQRLGEAYLATGSLDLLAEAKAEFQQALDLDPKLIWARFYLAKIYLDIGRLEKAKSELESALATRPNVPHLLSLLGETNRRLGNPSLSLDLNRKALAADPAMNAAHYHAALAYLDLKREDEALAELERALQSQYVIPEMYWTLASLHADRGKLDLAADLARKGIALDAARAEGHLKLGQIYRLQRVHGQALAELRLAAGGKLLLSTEYYQKLQADIFFETGRVHQDQGAVALAVQSYTQALEIYPNHADARRLLAALKAPPP